MVEEERDQPSQPRWQKQPAHQAPQFGQPPPADPPQQPGYGQQAGYSPASGYSPESGYPPQPGYPQPGYPQPGYPQPGYPQPGYPQPGYLPQIAKPTGWFIVNWLFFWPTAIYSLVTHWTNIDRAAYSGDLAGAQAHAAAARKLGIIALCIGLGLSALIIIMEVVLFAAVATSNSCVSVNGLAC